MPQHANSKVHDDDVAAAAIDIIRQHQPDVLFVHFPDVDAVGHAKGWGSQDQLAAVHIADAAMGRVITAWRTAGMAEHGLIVLTADHGGKRVHAWFRRCPQPAYSLDCRCPGLQKDYDLACAPWMIRYGSKTRLPPPSTGSR